MDLTITEQHNFIKDYYANVSYAELKRKYGLTKLKADKLWDELTDKMVWRKHNGKEESKESK